MLIAILIIVILVAVWGVSAYNGFVKADNNVEEAYSTMEVYLKKRYDLIPNLVETVKGYAKHESETLTKVIEARNAVGTATTTNAKVVSEAKLTDTLNSLFAIAEAYPDLKANANFQELMGQLERVELDIANARKYYNACVKNFNIKLQAFPSSIIGSLFHYEKKAMFEVADAAERENVKVSFTE
ncbi:MAG: LemA family protein [Mogibacterium sp.]|nr:LemA family protein [Mogibacterium sp.]